MTEYAPAAIQGLFNQIHAAIPAAVMSGILGDAAHTYGYHRGRNYVPASDYSVQLAEDKQGDGEAANGLDLSWSDASWQYTVSQRLLAAKNDSRMHACREFYGSTDGVTVCGWDYYGGYAVTSDSSHLWHIHLSILRKYANDPDALSGIASVITGGGSTGGDELSAAEVQQINAHTDQMLKYLWGALSGTPNSVYGGGVVSADTKARLEQLLNYLYPALTKAPNSVYSGGVTAADVKADTEAILAAMGIEADDTR
jgi:hypothetical protein